MASYRTSCRHHPQEQASLYCPTHKASICLVCASTKHRSCSEVKAVEDSEEEMRASLTELVSKLSSKETSVNVALQKIESIFQDHEKEKQTALKTIDQTFDRLQTVITESRCRMKEETRRKFDETKTLIKDTQSHLLIKRGTLAACRSVTERGHQCAALGEVHGMAQALKTQSEDFDSSSLMPKGGKPLVRNTLEINQERVSRIEKYLGELGQHITSPVSVIDEGSMGLPKRVRRVCFSTRSSNATHPSSVAAARETEDPCPICLDVVSCPKKLPCGHLFCTNCVDQAMAIALRCPMCQRLFGIPQGTQPHHGTMSHDVSHHSHLPGYPGCGIITITYDFPSGRQRSCHPNPGQRYSGTHRAAYLPANKEGHKVLKMLEKAFAFCLVFTVGDSVTSGASGVITWSDIHHKTRKHGGATQFGYPDPGYLHCVREDLAAKGITRP